MASMQSIDKNHKKHPLSILFATLAFLSLACGCNLSSIFTGMVGGIEGVGNTVEEERPVQGIRTVEISNQGDLFIEIGERESLVIEAQENLLPFIRSEVRDGSLRIYTSGTQIIRPTSPIRYYLTVQSLDEIVLTSSGDAQLPQLETEDFTIRITSSGDLTIDGLYADRADVQISSSGNVTIKDGRLREQRIMLSSSGDYDAVQLPSQIARAMLSSSGDARIYVTESLEASLSSSGDLFYRGNPTLKLNVSSSGEVLRIDD